MGEKSGCWKSGIIDLSIRLSLWGQALVRWIFFYIIVTYGGNASQKEH